MSFTGHENHDISLDDAAVLTKNYRDSQTGSEYIKGEFFGTDAIASLLYQNNCVGIRIYYGLDSYNVQRLVIVGVTADENDMVDGKVLELGTKCPPACSSNNVLNS